MIQTFIFTLYTWSEKIINPFFNAPVFPMRLPSYCHCFCGNTSFVIIISSNFSEMYNFAWFIRTRAAHWTNCLVKVWFLQNWPTANPKSCSNYEVWCHDSTCKPRNNNWIFNIWEDADLIWFFVILNFFMPFSILYLCCICIGMSRSACHQIWSESSQSASLGFIHHDNSNKWWGGDHLTSLYC